MATPAATMTREQELIHWIELLEQHVRALRAALGVRTAQPRLRHLMRTQVAAGRFLDKLVAVFWGQEEALRPALVPAYLSALLTLKLFADDVATEALEVARHPWEPGDRPDPQAAVTVDAAYQSFVERWIVVSPLINPRTYKDNQKYLPRVSNYIDMPHLRSMATGTQALLGGGDIEGPGAHPRKKAKDAVARDLRLIRTTPDRTRVSDETDHLLGLVFLLAQLELKLRWTNDATDRSGVDSWYQATLRPVEVMRDEVLGVFDEALRSAILAGRDAEADRLLTARHLTVLGMSTRYSFRGQETRTLLTFFDRQNRTGRFAFQHEVVGVNRVVETLFSYVGRNDPDDLDHGEALSVSSVIARETELLGRRVKVLGVMDLGRTSLEDELTRKRVDLDVTHPVRGFRGLRRDRRVVVEGELNRPGNALRVTTVSIVPHSEGYRALVGFPLRHAQTSEGGNLELTPGWRRTTEGLQRAAVREREEHEQGVFSVPETLAGQRELVTDLLRDDGVRKALGGTLSKKSDLDLLDREVRGKVWSALLARLARDHGHRDAMRLLIPYIQSYLSLFTKHTYFNVRDAGRPYLESPWPTDLTGRHFYDCGVYAVETAYGLFRATGGVPGLTMEFRFLTFLNHLCLIVYFDDQSFLVNNAQITRPEPMVKTGTPSAADRVAAAFAWGGKAFTTVYDVTYTLFLAVLPTLSLDTKRSDAAFKRDVFKMYQDSQGWGISNDAAVARDYFEAIHRFDRGSVRLAEQIVELKGRHRESADRWKAAARLALDLYTLGEAMTARSNFVFFNQAFVNAKPVPAVGYSIRPDAVVRRTGVTTLPMYELAAMLDARRRAGRRLSSDEATLAGKPREFAHVADLTKKF